VVDGVSDVMDFGAADVKQAPDFGTQFETDYIRGLVPVGERMVVLLDIDSLIGTQLSNLSANQQGPSPAVEAA
jgi:purine-binding chemotaxis protein CheW